MQLHLSVVILFKHDSWSIRHFVKNSDDVDSVDVWLAFMYVYVSYW